jgi:pilus assembly protein CpaB
MPDKLLRIQQAFSIGRDRPSLSHIAYASPALSRLRSYFEIDAEKRDVRSSTIIMIAVAGVFGLLAVFVAQSWLNRQAEARLKSIDAQKTAPAAMHTLVVAARPLRFGAELTPAALRELPWASEMLPAGAFTSINDVLSGGKHIVLTAIEANEPVLATKITGSGQRATLSAVLADGKKASTIRVNDVDGVAGFVLPGDHVDVMVSRQLDKGTAVNDVVLANAKVLAVDQLADERADKPAVAKAVTLEVDIAGAQKLSLAGQIGTLSLALRKAGDSEPVSSHPITLGDLFNAKTDEPDNGRYATVTVVRAANKTLYSVPRTGRDGHVLADVGPRHHDE